MAIAPTMKNASARTHMPIAEGGGNFEGGLLIKARDSKDVRGVGRVHRGRLGMPAGSMGV